MTAVVHALIRWPKRLFDVFSSYGLSVVLLVLLFLLTYLGTIEQTRAGLYAVQEKYFGSIIMVHWFFDRVPLVLPGARLLMGLLTVNLVCGGLLRIRKDWRRLGVFITHLGILILMVGGFLTFHYSVNGHMTLYEGETSDEFVSHHDWEIAITEMVDRGQARQLIIPGSQFTRLSSADEVLFHSEALPFTVTLRGFEANCVVDRADSAGSGDHDSISGQVLRPIPLNPDGEQNTAGIYARIGRSDGVSEVTLWAAGSPAIVTADNTAWRINLRKRRWQLPFAITLNKFTHEFHPRTKIPRVFMSDVTKTENGVSQKIKIAMNRPLRHKGYTFFQASWGPDGAGPGDRLFSSFAVVRNPADQFPLYASVIITVGLAVHFAVGFLRYVHAQRRALK